MRRTTLPLLLLASLSLGSCAVNRYWQYEAAPERAGFIPIDSLHWCEITPWFWKNDREAEVRVIVRNRGSSPVRLESTCVELCSPQQSWNASPDEPYPVPSEVMAMVRWQRRRPEQPTLVSIPMSDRTPLTVPIENGVLLFVQKYPFRTQLPRTVDTMAADVELVLRIDGKSVTINRRVLFVKQWKNYMQLFGSC